MPEDKTNRLPDDRDIKGPTPPTNPVEFSRWVQRPRVTPKKPKVQPDDSELRPEGLKKPDINRSIGTDKPKRSKLKNPNNTKLPVYLRPNKGSKTAPGAENGNLIKFMEWLDESGIGVELNKMTPTTLAAFGLGWYISDNLTRDEKQSWQRQLDNEFKRSVERQEKAKTKRIAGSGRSMNKSAFEELQKYYQGLIR
jgi:hypothetical protein